MDKIAAADPELARRLDVVRNSDLTHVIQLPNRPDGNRQAENKTDIRTNGLELSAPSGANGERAPTTTLFDPDFVEATSPESTLTHELLSHAYEKDQGRHKRDYEPGGSPYGSHEDRAVDIENIYRGAVGEELRDGYDGF